MFLPIFRVEVCVRDRVAAVQHDGIAHIDTAMAHAGLSLIHIYRWLCCPHRHHRHPGADRRIAEDWCQRQSDRTAAEQHGAAVHTRCCGHQRSAGTDMAVTKIHPIKSTLKKALNYIENPAKTEDVYKRQFIQSLIKRWKSSRFFTCVPVIASSA